MSVPLSTLRTQRSKVTLSLTPLIDVVFILLVFFMLVSQFANWRQIDLHPQAMLGSGTADTQPLVVVLRSDHSIQIAQRVTQETGQAAMIVKELLTDDGRPVIVQALPGVEIQPVIDLVEALADAQIDNVRVDARGAEKAE